MNDEDPPRRAHARLSFQLARAEHAMRRQLDAALAPLDLSITAFAVLGLLDAEPGLSGSELARRSFITQQAVAALLVRLERSGLVTRAMRPTNRRIVDFHVTAEGRARLEQGESVVRHREDALREALGPIDVDHITAVVSRCADFFERRRDPPPGPPDPDSRAR